MHSAAHRLAATALTLAALASPAAAAFGKAPPAQAMLPIAALWLALLGWGFRHLLGRHLQSADQLACAQGQIGIERQARQLAERGLADSHTSLCRLIHQQEHVREHERNRIARDLHDDLGQRLLALKIELSLMQVGTGAPHLRQQQVAGMLHGLDLATASLRAIVNDLRPLALDQGLQAAMQAHLSEFSRVNGIRHELEAGADAFPVHGDRAVDAMLFRIMQESLANVVRHAQATEVKIALRRHGDQLSMHVRDNGIGMAGQPASRGCGLVGIADRVLAAGGRFAIDSEPGAGTLLSLSVPLSRRDIPGVSSDIRTRAAQ